MRIVLLTTPKIVKKNKSFEMLVHCKNGINVIYSQYTYNHLAVLLNINLNETKQEAFQISMDFVTGVKLTSNRKRNQAGLAGENQMKQFASAKYWPYINIKEVVVVQIRGVNRKHPPALLKKKAGLEVHSKELVSDKTPGTHSLHTLNIRNFCRFCFRKYIYHHKSDLWQLKMFW